MSKRAEVENWRNILAYIFVCVCACVRIASLSGYVCVSLKTLEDSTKTSSPTGASHLCTSGNFILEIHAENETGYEKMEN